MYCEFLKLTDIIDEQGLNRFRIKRSRRQCERIYDAYTSHVYRLIPRDRWYLNQDYTRLSYEATEQKIDFLYYAAFNLLSRHHIARTQALARSICVHYLLEVIADTWKLYFRTYKELYGIDFSREFAYADMTAFAHAFRQLHAELFSVSREDIYILDDQACKAAVTALRNHLDNEDIFDDAALRAMKLNPEVYRQYQSDIKAIEKQRDEVQAELNTAILEQKYKVTKKKA